MMPNEFVRESRRLKLAGEMSAREFHYTTSHRACRILRSVRQRFSPKPIRWKPESFAPGPLARFRQFREAVEPTVKPAQLKTAAKAAESTPVKFLKQQFAAGKTPDKLSREIREIPEHTIQETAPLAEVDNPIGKSTIGAALRLVREFGVLKRKVEVDRNWSMQHKTAIDVWFWNDPEGSHPEHIVVNPKNIEKMLASLAPQMRDIKRMKIYNPENKYVVPSEKIVATFYN